MTVSTQSLPWSSLPIQEDNIPWDDFRVFAESAAQSPDVRRELMNRMDDLLDRRYAGDKNSYQDLSDFSIPAIFAMAAERFDDAGRGDVAEFLIHLLYRAGQAEDEFLLEVGEKTAGRIGPAIIEPAMRVLKEEGTDLECWSEVLSLLQIAADTEEPTRSLVTNFCRGVIRDAPDHFEWWYSMVPALRVLTSLGDVKSLPMLRDIQKTANSSDIAETIEKLESGRPDAPSNATHPWLMPPEQWLPEYVQDVRKWLDEQGDFDYDDEEMDEHRIVDNIIHLVETFEQSQDAKSLPDLALNYAGGAGYHALHYANYLFGIGARQLKPIDLEEILLDCFPRKISNDKDFFEHAPAVLKCFFRWLESIGRINNSDALNQVVDDSAVELIRRSQDPDYWGPAKRFIMAAVKEGVDICDPDALNTYMAFFNSRLALQKSDAIPSPAPSDKLRTLPTIIPTQKKTGRNQPCPCGSGKKYKKCCMS